MISDAIALFELLSKARSSLPTKSALFDAQGNRLQGDPDIQVEAHSWDNQKSIYYRITPIEGYEFLRFPVNPGGVQEHLAADGLGNHDSFFKYVATSHHPLRPTQTAPQVMVKFIVVGYKTSDLLGLMEGQAPH